MLETGAINVIFLLLCFENSKEGCRNFLGSGKSHLGGAIVL